MKRTKKKKAIDSSLLTNPLLEMMMNKLSFEDKISSNLFTDIYKILGVTNQIEAGLLLNLRSSDFSESVKKGYISDEIFVAMARHGIDIRELIPKNKPQPIREMLANILHIKDNYEDIIGELDITIDDIKECELMGYITDKVLIALSRKGYDIRNFWSNKHISEQ